MNTMIDLIDPQATNVLFNVSIVLAAYVIARLASARGAVAFAFAFTPLLLFWALDNGMSRNVLAGVL